MINRIGNRIARWSGDGRLYAVLSACGFSMKAVFVKLAYAAAPVDASTLLALRMGFTLPLFAWLTYRSSDGKPLARSDLGRIAMLGCLGYYLSSLFDYIRRAMPFGDAQSLTNDELYAVTAYVLNLNDIVDDKFVLSKETWTQVKMPNANGFFDDDRETSEKAFWNPNPCMKDCRGPVSITGHAQAIDVTPDEKKVPHGVE